MEYAVIGLLILLLIAVVAALMYRNELGEADATIRVLKVSLASSLDKSRRLGLVVNDLEEELDAVTQKALPGMSRDELRSTFRRLLSRAEGRAGPLPPKPTS